MERKRSVRRPGGYPRRHKPLGEKIKDFLRQFVAFMFSNVGIIGLVVGYTIVGAFIFQRIEGDNTVVQDRREELQSLVAATADRLWNLTCCGVIPLEELVWRNEATELVRAYQNDLVKAYKASGSDSAKSTDNWSFSGAFLYSLTVITTIGYGNVTPRSETGKITTVLYAIIGMPLFLLYLSNIGDILAKSFKWTYAKVWLCKGCPGARRRRLMRAMQQGGLGPGLGPGAALSVSKYNLKAGVPVAVDIGDNHSWTPGAHPATLAARRLGPLAGARGAAGAHDAYLSGVPGPPFGRHIAAEPRGRRARPAYGPEDEEDDEEDGWGRPPRGRGRVRRVGMDHGREDADAAYHDAGWPRAASALSSRSRSRSALRSLRSEAGAAGAAGADPRRGRTPASMSVSPADLAASGRAGHGRPRGRSSQLSDSRGEDLELGFPAPGPHGRPGGAKQPGGGRRDGRGEQAPDRGLADGGGDEDEEYSEEEEVEEETPSSGEGLDEEELDEEELEEEELDEEEDSFDDDDVDDGEVADEDTDGESSAASSKSYDPQTVTVPVTLCLAIMVGYVCGGAVLFAKWEDWDMLDGSYFCFISLSTIGFGDIVPGGSVYSESIELAFIFCSMYLMLGMALIAMCFNLMQEEVIHKMRSCVRTLRYVTRCNRRRAAAAAAAAAAAS